jgi:hypothetical protein
MSIVNLRKYKQKRAERKTLCASGFHKWEFLQQRFDVREGRLVSAERCTRCGEERIRLT